MDHKTVLDRLSSADKVNLTLKSDAKGLRHLAAYGLLVLASSIWIALEAPLWPLMMIVQGVLLVFLFTLCHECTHQSPYKSAWLNEWVGHATGGMMFLPFLWFRYFHLAHHRHTNDPENDPELAGPKPECWADYIVHVSGFPYWKSQVTTIFRNAFGDATAPYLPQRAHQRIQREARVLLAIYAILFASLVVSPLALTLWIIPLLLGQPFLRLYLLAEHGRCPPVANMLENTRTTFTNRIVRFLAWNMPYHIEHHSFPAVPFHALPKLHEHMKQELITTSSGYLAFTSDYVQDLGMTNAK
ncbi:MAG: fatty acid desaturase [Paracoccaceae bacterium]|nr:fatty acid desaturase [Paracoccaceae bacterium]